MASHITLTINDNIATILLDRPKALNALTLDDYQLLATLLRRVAANDAVTITVITGTGKYFSAGADVHASTGNSPTDPKDEATRKYWLSKFAAGNIDVTKAFISHPKILIAALNGPVIGLSAALVAHCDFIYASQSAFILTPFASLGLVAEGASSYMFVKRMGLSLANSALITGARIPASQLLACGFVNEVFPAEGFSEAVQKHIAETFGSHLNPESMLRIKSLVRASYARELEAVNVMEHFEGLQRFAEGVPQAKFAEVSSGKRRHKL